MARVLEFLYMEELCAALGTSSWLRSHVLNALQRRKFVCPDVRHQKWGKSSFVSGGYPRHYRSNFDGRNERLWSSEYASAIVRHCKNVKEVESGFLAKQRFQLKGEDDLYFESFSRNDFFVLINRCSKITHIDGIVSLHVADLANVATNTLAVKALCVTFDREWTHRVDVLSSFLAKCVALEHLELVDGGAGSSSSVAAGTGGDVNFVDLMGSAMLHLQEDSSSSSGVATATRSGVSLVELVSGATLHRPGCFDNVRSLKINDFNLRDVDVDGFRNAFPNLTALALDMSPENKIFLMNFLSQQKDPLRLLELTIESSYSSLTLEGKNDLLLFTEASDPILAREVVVKVLTEGVEMWKTEYVRCFPQTHKLTLVFLRGRYDHPNGRDLSTFELNHLERLQSRYSFGMDDYDRDSCDRIGLEMRDSAPWVETLHVAVVDMANLSKFGLHERYSPAIEKRALSIMRGSNILLNLPEKQPNRRGRRRF